MASLDRLEIAKSLKLAGFSDDQAEAVTRAVRKAHEVDLSQIATKADLSELKVELVRWVFGIAFAQAALILAVLKLFPAGHP